MCQWPPQSYRSWSLFFSPNNFEEILKYNNLHILINTTCINKDHIHHFLKLCHALFKFMSPFMLTLKQPRICFFVTSLHFLEFSINIWILYSIFPCLVWQSIMILKFIHAVACINSLLLFTAFIKLSLIHYSIGWIYHNLFIHSLVYRHSDCFQILAIIKLNLKIFLEMETKRKQILLNMEIKYYLP